MDGPGPVEEIGAFDGEGDEVEAVRGDFAVDRFLVVELFVAACVAVRVGAQEVAVVAGAAGQGVVPVTSSRMLCAALSAGDSVNRRFAYSAAWPISPPSR